MPSLREGVHEQLGTFAQDVPELLQRRRSGHDDARADDHDVVVRALVFAGLVAELFDGLVAGPMHR